MTVELTDERIRELLEQAIPGAEELERSLARDVFSLTPEQERRRFTTQRYQRHPKGGRK